MSDVHPPGARRVCADRATAHTALHDLGGPVAVKILDVAILHKTEVGGVHLSALSAADLDAALDKLHAIGARPYVVEAMAPAGIDLIVGARSALTLPKECPRPRPDERGAWRLAGGLHQRGVTARTTRSRSPSRVGFCWSGTSCSPSGRADTQWTGTKRWRKACRRRQECETWAGHPADGSALLTRFANSVRDRTDSLR